MTTATIDLFPFTIDPSLPWRQTVDQLVQALIQAELPFSSGEVARLIRTREPSVVFSARGVGTHLRDAYAGGTLPLYASTGTIIQADRYTGDGHLVFVYGPDLNAAGMHPFEVDVPLYQDPNASATGTSAAALLQPASAPVKHRAPPLAEDEARVNNDGTISVSNLAIAKLNVAPGDAVYLEYHNNDSEVRIFATSQGITSIPYRLNKDRTRLTFKPVGRHKGLVAQRVIKVDISNASSFLLSINLDQ